MNPRAGSSLALLLSRWEASRVDGVVMTPEELCRECPELLGPLKSRIAIFEAIDPALGLGGAATGLSGEVVEPKLFSDLPSMSDLQPGRIVGKYRLTRPLGHGGFGVVYEGERIEEYEQRVAIKFLHGRGATPETLARFAAEAQTLAVIKHANVATVLDAGVTAAGLPYLVMEYIDGVPLPDYCEAKKLGPVERINLLLYVCDAVVAAHAKSVAHRDLKPSNILVATSDSAAPIVKVIDFGIAKVIGPVEPEELRLTHEGERLGTPAYASPEQLGVGVGTPDTRSDIYSLGVVLYELLTGVLPYQRARAEELSVFELQKRMELSEPVGLSSRWRTRSSAPSAAESLPAVVPIPPPHRRELGWIVMKCLEVDPERRYQTCREFAADLKNFLDGRPVLAGPRSTTYRIKKFVQRNRVGVGAAFVACLSLVAGLLAMSYGYAASVRERDRALKAEAETRLIAEFQSERLASIDPETMGAGVRESILSQCRAALEGQSVAADAIDDQIELLDESLARVNFTTLAHGLIQRGVFEPSIKAAEASFAESPALLGRLLQSVAVAQDDTGLLAESLATQERTLDVRRSSLGEEHQDTLESLRQMGNILKGLGKPAEAEPLIRQALEAQRRVLGDTHVETLTSLNDLGATLNDLGRTEEAEKAYREALAGCETALGPDHELTFIAHGNLAGELDHQGKLSEAEPHYRAALDGMRRVLGETHPDTILSINNLGVFLFRSERAEEAERVLNEGLALSRRVMGDNHPRTLLAIGNLGVIVERRGDLAAAEKLYRESAERRERVLGRSHESTVATRNNLSGLLRRLDRLDEAQQMGEEVVEVTRRTFGPNHWRTGVFQSNLARTLAARSDLAEAVRLMLESHEILVASLGASHQRIRENAGHLAKAYEAWNEKEPSVERADAAARWKALAETKP